MPDKQGRYKPGVPTQINDMKNVEPFGLFRWVPAGEGAWDAEQKAKAETKIVVKVKGVR